MIRDFGDLQRIDFAAQGNLVALTGVGVPYRYGRAVSVQLSGDRDQTITVVIKNDPMKARQIEESMWGWRGFLTGLKRGLPWNKSDKPFGLD